MNSIFRSIRVFCTVTLFSWQWNTFHPKFCGQMCFFTERLMFALSKNACACWLYSYFDTMYSFLVWFCFPFHPKFSLMPNNLWKPIRCQYINITVKCLYMTELFVVLHLDYIFALLNMCKMNRINPKTIEYPRRVTSIVLNGEKYSTQYGRSIERSPAFWAKEPIANQ